MDVAVVGSGYVGLVTGTCFAEMGNNVWCIDIDNAKIENLKNGIIPIYEPGLEEMVKRNHAEKRLNFTTSIEEGVKSSLFVFIAVGTPPGEDGSADLTHVLSVASEIGKTIDKYTIVIDKSTVPVGTAFKVEKKIRDELHARGRNDIELDVVSNPEFLKEGNAIEDFMRPDRVVIGTANVRTGELMRELYSSFVRSGDRIIVMDILSAELTKYAANSMLATRISFMNELSALCDITGADIENVRKGIGTDSRIGKSFLYAGVGYGGSCFPKDVKALIKTTSEFGLRSKILESVEEVNADQKQRFVDRIVSVMGSDMKGKTIAVWGLSFKPNTDDMREAPAIEVIHGLKEHGASIMAYDPIAADNARAVLGSDNIKYVDHYYDAIEGADALVLLTEWHQFRNPDFNRIKNVLKNPVIFDGRNQYDPQTMAKRGFDYYSIGRKHEEKIG